MIEVGKDNEIEVLKSILSSRQLVLGWTDTKAQNLITASSILMAVIGMPLIVVHTIQLSVITKVLLDISGLSTLITLSLSLFVTKFRFANQSEFPQRGSITSIFGTIKFLKEQKGLKNSLIKKYQEQLLSLGKSPINYYAESILINSIIAYKKARLLNIAIFMLQIAVVSLGLAFLLILMW